MHANVGGNLNAISKHNRTLVLRLVQKFGPISKPKIAEMTGLSVASINKIVRGLQEVWLVTESGLGETNHQGGRPPALYSICTDKGYVIAVDLSGPVFRIGAVDLQGNILFKTEFAREPDAASLIYTLIQHINDMRQAFRKDEKELLGIGVAVSGLVDSEQGMVIRSVPLGWENVPLRNILEETFRCLVIIGKETHAAVQAHHALDADVNYENLLYVYLGTGICMAIAVNGVLLKGSNKMAGELGHCMVRCDGRSDEPQPTRFLEEVASTNALVSHVHQAIATDCDERSQVYWQRVLAEGLSVTASDVLIAAKHNDVVAREAVKEVASHIATALYNANRLFDPEAVYVGGSLGRQNQILFEAIREQSQGFPNLLPDEPQLASKLVSDFSDDTVLTGASTWVIEKALELRVTATLG